MATDSFRRHTRGPANSRAGGEPLALVRSWAAREGLAFAPAVQRELAASAATVELAA
jgi:hypothetical protein